MYEGSTIIDHENKSVTSDTKRVSPAPRNAAERIKLTLSNKQYTATNLSRIGTMGTTVDQRAGSSSRNRAISGAGANANNAALINVYSRHQATPRNAVF